ncbi:MAG: hypothetical protein ACOY94_03790 [Bacillota bacterium]
MSKWTRFIWLGGYACLFVLLLSSVAFADPLDDAKTQLTEFLTKAATIVSGLIPTAGGLAVAGLAVKRKMAKTMGEEDGMARANNQIVEVLKLTAVGTGASLLVAIAGSALT